MDYRGVKIDWSGFRLSEKMSDCDCRLCDYDTRENDHGCRNPKANTKAWESMTQEQCFKAKPKKKKTKKVN